MGMYDEISPLLTNCIIRTCPFCFNGYNNDNLWQTKDFDNILKVITLDDINCDCFEMHHICENCGRYISLMVDLSGGTFRFKGSYNDNYSDYVLFYDQSLRLEYKKLHPNMNKNFKECLESMDIGYHGLIQNMDIESDNLLSMIYDITRDFYCIPKEKLENFK